MGRAATVGTIRFGGLVQLGEGTFDEAGCHAHQADNPHPEDGAGATEGNGHRNAGDIAAANPAGNRQDQGLKGTEVASVRLVMVGGQDAEHLAEVTKLNEAGGDGEPDSDADQHGNQNLAPQQVAEGG